MSSVDKARNPLLQTKSNNLIKNTFLAANYAEQTRKILLSRTALAFQAKSKLMLAQKKIPNTPTAGQDHTPTANTFPCIFRQKKDKQKSPKTTLTSFEFNLNKSMHQRSIVDDVDYTGGALCCSQLILFLLEFLFQLDDSSHASFQFIFAGLHCFLLFIDD